MAGRTHRPTTAETRDRILEVTEELLAGRDFVTVPVLEICNAAGVSSSSLYNLFPSKLDLTRALYDRILQRSLAQAMDRFESAAPAGDAPLEQLVRAALEALLEAYKSRLHLLGAFEAAERDYPEFARQRFEMERDAVGMLRDMFMARYGADAGVSPSRVEFIIRAASTVVQRSVSGPVTWEELMGMDDHELVDEVVRMVVAYLDSAAT